MESRTEMSALRNSARGARLAGAFVLMVMVVACMVFWVGVPIGVLWGLGQATDSFAGHFVLGLLLVPMAMAVFSPVLFWLNNLYLRVTGVLARLQEDHRQAGWQRRVRGPLEPMLFISFVIAVVALSIWFFFVAEDPPRQII